MHILLTSWLSVRRSVHASLIFLLMAPLVALFNGTRIINIFWSELQHCASAKWSNTCPSWPFAFDYAHLWPLSYRWFGNSDKSSHHAVVMATLETETNGGNQPKGLTIPTVGIIYYPPMITNYRLPVCHHPVFSPNWYTTQFVININVITLCRRSV